MQNVKKFTELNPRDKGKHVIFTRGQGTLHGWNKKGMNLMLLQDDGRVHSFNVSADEKLILKENKVG